MKIFIIGSNSFIGSSLIDYIFKSNINKYKVYGCSRSAESSRFFNLYKNNLNNKFKFYKIDLNTGTKKIIKILKKIKPNIIFNFAAQSIVEYSWKSPKDWFDTNLNSNILLLEYLKNVDYLDKYIQSSTPEVYGSVNKKLEENFIYSPSTPYATSKASIDMLLKIYFDNYKFPVVFTRASNIYGPGQKLYKLIPKAIVSLLKNIGIPLHGKGLSKRSFIYIDDVSSAMLKVINNSSNGNVYHITNEEMYSIKKVVSIICKLMHKKFEKYTIIESDRLGKDFIYNMNSKKLRKIGWKPKIDLVTGIKLTSDWVHLNYDVLKKIKLNYIHKK